MKSIVMQNLTKTTAVLILSIAILCAAGCKKHNSGNGSYNGHDYIDLGLPSGTMWATCNVGADTPEDHGDYFAWGETTPKTTYNWSTYIFSKGDYNQLTKYCGQSDFGFNGFTDNLKSLLASDDAATANWGEGWCTPTYNQWVELLRKCSHTWITINGVNGCLFTSRNGNSIFLPAASSRRDGDSRNAGDDGCYWSSTLNKTYPDGVKGFRFTLSIDDYDIYDLSREAGMPVRAVCSSR